MGWSEKPHWRKAGPINFKHRGERYKITDGQVYGWCTIDLRWVKDERFEGSDWTTEYAQEHVIMLESSL